MAYSPSSPSFAEIENMAAELNKNFGSSKDEMDDSEDEEDEDEDDSHEHLMIIACQKYVFKPFVVAFAAALGLSTGSVVFNAFASFPWNPFRARAPPPPVPAPQPAAQPLLGPLLGMFGLKYA
mmetsp:Transcript_143188/g.249854  ORF Transcript_143188/g.249854 Transcript_143188/m.249854 type:complete len:123 (-) Transcript_143188:435-803(-)